MSVFNFSNIPIFTGQSWSAPSTAIIELERETVVVDRYKLDVEDITVFNCLPPMVELSLQGFPVLICKRTYNCLLPALVFIFWNI